MLAVEDHEVHVSAHHPRETPDSEESRVIGKFNNLLQKELSKRSDFKREYSDSGTQNGRVWRVHFSNDGRNTTIQYFNDDIPREYHVNLPAAVVKELVEVVKSHETVSKGNHEFDVALFYDTPVVSIAVD